MKFNLFIITFIFSVNSFANYEYDFFVDCDFVLDNGKKINVFNNGRLEDGQTELNFQYNESDVLIKTYKTEKVTSDNIGGFTVEVYYFPGGKLLLNSDDYNMVKSGILSLESGTVLSDTLSVESIEVSCAVSK